VLRICISTALLELSRAHTGTGGVPYQEPLHGGKKRARAKGAGAKVDIFKSVVVWSSVLHGFAVCCSVLQRVTACCSVLQRVAACPFVADAAPR